MMSGRLSGKVCVITGTGGSVGRGGTGTKRWDYNVMEFRIYLWRGVQKASDRPFPLSQKGKRSR
jgi:hypothetical protein